MKIGWYSGPSLSGRRALYGTAELAEDGSLRYAGGDIPNGPSIEWYCGNTAANLRIRLGREPTGREILDALLRKTSGRIQTL